MLVCRRWESPRHLPLRGGGRGDSPERPCRRETPSSGRAQGERAESQDLPRDGRPVQPMVPLFRMEPNGVVRMLCTVSPLVLRRRWQPAMSQHRAVRDRAGRPPTQPHAEPSRTCERGTRSPAGPSRDWPHLRRMPAVDTSEPGLTAPGSAPRPVKDARDGGLRPPCPRPGRRRRDSPRRFHPATPRPTKAASPTSDSKRIMAGRAGIPTACHRVMLMAHPRRGYVDRPPAAPRCSPATKILTEPLCVSTPTRAGQ